MACPAPSRRAAALPKAAPALTLLASPPAQQPFDFLFALPLRERRRRQRAQPHLRGRTAAGTQLVLRFTRPKPGNAFLAPEVAEAFEAALREAQGRREGSPRQRAAEARLLELLHPFLAAAAREAWEAKERTHLSREDLLQEARVRALKLWRGFAVGRAGPGRTLYPGYVGKAVRQHLTNVLSEARLVRPTQHGRKLAARARRREKREAVPYEEALRTEGADATTALALALGATCVEESEALQLADEGGEARAELALAESAVRALQHLPRRQRLAVAVPLGLDKLRLPDVRLAAHLDCTLAELQQARAQGLAALREHIEAA